MDFHGFFPERSLHAAIGGMINTFYWGAPAQ
jgi:hypothetical protein